MANVSSSNSQEALVPKLRFPGFEGDYILTHIGDVFSERAERGGATMELLSVTMNDGVVKRSQIEGKDNSSEDKSNYKIVRSGDLVYNSMRMWQGANGISKYDGIVSPAYTVLKAVQEIDEGYFAALFKTVKLINEFRKNSQGLTSDTWNLKYPQIAGIRICVPKLSEQHKISSFLRLLDERIDAQRRLVEALKSYKRGALSKLFPKEGASVPEYRFAGFSGDWEERKVSEVMATRRGLTYKPSDIKENGVRVLRSSNIDGDKFVLKDDDVFVDKKAVNVDYAKENDILITAANGSSRLVGKHAIICEIPGDSAVHGGFMLLGTANEPFFINASMSSPWYKKFIDLFVAGGNGTIGNLNKNDLDNQYIPIPSNSEQKKVGYFFRLLDNLITLHQQEVSIAQKIKSGLLNGLFI